MLTTFLADFFVRNMLSTLASETNVCLYSVDSRDYYIVGLGLNLSVGCLMQYTKVISVLKCEFDFGFPVTDSRQIKKPFHNHK